MSNGQNNSNLGNGNLIFKQGNMQSNNTAPVPTQTPTPTPAPTSAPAPEVKKEASPSGKKNCSVRMLIMAFVTFLCITFMPILTIPNINVDIYVVDAFRVAQVGITVPEVSEGDIVSRVEEMMQEETEETRANVEAGIATPEAVYAVEETASLMVKLAGKVDPIIVEACEHLKVVSVLVIIAVSLLAVAYACMLFFAAKNKKLLYAIVNGVILAAYALVTLGIVAFTSISLSAIGYGIWVSIVALAVSCVIPFIGKKK